MPKPAAGRGGTAPLPAHPAGTAAVLHGLQDRGLCAADRRCGLRGHRPAGPRNAGALEHPGGHRGGGRAGAAARHDEAPPQRPQAAVPDIGAGLGGAGAVRLGHRLAPVQRKLRGAHPVYGGAGAQRRVRLRQPPFYRERPGLPAIEHRGGGAALPGVPAQPGTGADGLDHLPDRGHHHLFKSGHL